MSAVKSLPVRTALGLRQGAPRRTGGTELSGAATWQQITGSYKDSRLFQTEPS